MELKATVTAKGKILDGMAPEIAQKNLESAMYEAVALLERAVKQNIRKAGRVGVGGAKGGLLSTIHGEVIEKGMPIMKGIVATQSKYGLVIEKGRSPGQKMPPADALDRWIDVKLGTISRSAKTFKSMDHALAYISWKKSISFLIRRKIGRKGFPGIYMFEKAWTENLPKIQRMFEKAGFNITRELNGK